MVKTCDLATPVDTDLTSWQLPWPNNMNFQSQLCFNSDGALSHHHPWFMLVREFSRVTVDVVL